MTGTIIQFYWVLGKASAEISGDDGREYIHLCDGKMRLCAGERVRFELKDETAPAPRYKFTPRSVEDRSIPEVDIIEFSAAANAALIEERGNGR